MPNKFDFDPDDNPTLNLNGSSKAVVVLFNTESKEEAVRLAQAIPGFTPDLEKVGTVDGFPGMSVVGQATTLIEEEGDVTCVFPFKGVLEACDACKAKQ